MPSREPANPSRRTIEHFSERGDVLAPDVPLLPGEMRGTGWAETISNLAQRLKIEVEGPARARGRE